MSHLELVAVILGLINIVLIVLRSVWNYPFGIVMVLLYAGIFWNAGLLSDAGLQIFFLCVQVWGWINWSRHRDNGGAVQVRRLSAQHRACWIAGSIAATLVWGTIMHRFTPASLPYWDGSIAMLSVAAQLLMTWRYLENWWWWIAVNVLSIGIYAAKGLWPTAGLYVVFLAFAVFGVLEWRRHLREEAAA